MRIGTWNLAGMWNGDQANLMRGQDCDVWLLTEVSETLSFDGYMMYTSTACMAKRRRWAAILSNKQIAVCTDPHPTSALAHVGEISFCSSVLPWRSCPSRAPWVGTSQADKTKATLNELLMELPRTGLVWGGDWNHSLKGIDYSGSKEGCLSILAAVEELGLQVPTAALPHRIPTLTSIDHIAVAKEITGIVATHVVASVAGNRLSDHDLYVLEVSGW